jgi:ribosome biogenesis GTPase / thiamine phosphate phosphatase
MEISKVNEKKYIHPIMSADFADSLEKLGWSAFFRPHLDHFCDAAHMPARVVGARKNRFYVSQGKEDRLVTTAGRLHYQADGLYPVVGDWVVVDDTVITAVFPRKNALSRGAAGAQGKQHALPWQGQVLAANLDTVWVVCGLDRDFNLRRIERYLTLIYNCALNPVIVLTKADLHPDPEAFVHQVEAVAFGVPVHLVSANETTGLARLEVYLSRGRTVTLTGSSGAGKSTLVNRLYGKPVQATHSISERVGKGTHTTTSRDLIIMPQGGMLIDNPGIREISFWDVDGGIESAFPEIETLVTACRFADCTHLHEPGCRVRRAVAEGQIAAERLESYHKMKRELRYLADRQHKSAGRVEKERWKSVATTVKAIKKSKWQK